MRDGAGGQGEGIVMGQYKVAFDSVGRIEWIKTIADTIAQFGPLVEAGDQINIRLPSETEKFEAVHLASLACFIEFFYKKGCNAAISLNVRDFIFDKLNWPAYWANHQDYTEAKDSTIFNLWRITDEGKEAHSQQVYEFLKRGPFKEKDLSAVPNSLLEAYYNIFDHAEANGIAFSFIRYIEEKQKLSVAICDLGKGIAMSVKEKCPDIRDDSSAIELAMEDRFTIQSKTHNRGFGLGNIRTTCTDEDALRIISNRGFLITRRDEINKRENNFNFPGTLIFYDLTLSHFEEEEIIANFEL